MYHSQFTKHQGDINIIKHEIYIYTYIYIYTRLYYVYKTPNTTLVHHSKYKVTKNDKVNLMLDVFCFYSQQYEYII